jgi:hypothetical protein
MIGRWSAEERGILFGGRAKKTQNCGVEASTLELRY